MSFFLDMDLLGIDIDNDIRLQLVETLDELVRGTDQVPSRHGFSINDFWQIVHREVQVKWDARIEHLKW